MRALRERIFVFLNERQWIATGVLLFGFFGFMGGILSKSPALMLFSGSSVLLVVFFGVVDPRHD